MKKKDGFTLAEILITLGIVGVVAAMTVPRLMNNTSTSQIGPKLAKAAAAFEQANQAMPLYLKTVWNCLMEVEKYSFQQ